MAETDDVVTVAGKSIDNAKVTRGDQTAVDRQRIVIADPSDPEAPGLGVRGEPERGMTVGESEIIALLTRINTNLELLILKHELGMGG